MYIHIYLSTNETNSLNNLQLGLYVAPMYYCYGELAHLFMDFVMLFIHVTLMF